MSFHGVRAHIIYNGYVDDNKVLKIGGAQSYLNNLVNVLAFMGFAPNIYQKSKSDFAIQIGVSRVIGIADVHDSSGIIKSIEKESHNCEKDLLIFGADTLICKHNFKHCISIQHGISWDINENCSISKARNFYNIIKGSVRAIHMCQRFKWCNNIVCVDYNFLNWFRTQVAHIDVNLTVIPNFAHVGESVIKRNNENNVSIVFARRLIDYRGTKLFAKSIIEISKNNPKVLFTIAGVGPDEGWLHQYLDGMSNVRFTTYNHEDGVDFHSKYDIAVIPTKGAEGTSLSLLEAMAAGCAVIATNVGGLTNVVIDGFNGLLINPRENELIQALQKLINDNTLRQALSRKAYETVYEGFSYSRWTEKWISFIHSVYFTM